MTKQSDQENIAEPPGSGSSLVEPLTSHLYSTLEKHYQDKSYLRTASLSTLYENQVNVHVGDEEIATALTSLISSANREVLLQFNEFDANSELGMAVMNAFKLLNEKNRSNVKKIKIKLIVNMLIPSKEPKYRFDHLDIERQFPDYSASDASHNHQVIVDKHTLLITTGDLHIHLDTINIATVIENVNIAYDAAKSFHSRFKQRELSKPLFGNSIAIQSIVKVEEVKTTSLLSKLIDWILNKVIHYFHKQEGNKTTSSASSETQVSNGNHDIPTDTLPSSSNDTFLFLEQNASSNPLQTLCYRSPYKKALLKAIYEAENTIQIMLSDLDDPDVIAALVEVATQEEERGKVIKQGVKIDLIINRQNKAMDAHTGINRLLKELPIFSWDNINIRMPWESSKANLPGQLAIIDDRIVIMGSSTPTLHHTRYSQMDSIIESSTTAEKYQRVIVDRIDKTESMMPGKLYTLKQSLIADINRQLLAPRALSFFRHTAHDTRTQEKITASHELICQIQACKTFKELVYLMSDNIVVDAHNKFAQPRRKNLLKPDYRMTETIDKLEAIIDRHFVKREWRECVEVSPGLETTPGEPDSLSKEDKNLDFLVCYGA